MLHIFCFVLKAKAGVNRLLWCLLKIDEKSLMVRVGKIEERLKKSIAKMRVWFVPD